jgi:hypothetical protein
MLIRPAFLAVVLLSITQVVAQDSTGTTPGDSPTWKSASPSGDSTAIAGDSSPRSQSPGTEHAPITLVTKGTGVLPNDHGQIWREYDIRPYTSHVTNTERPEQAIIDWILRETGTEVWFTEPFGILNANSQTLRVYHTEEMQRLVLDVVDRFVSSQAEPQALSLRLVTIGSPNWRSTAVSLMQPIDVKSTGVEAWLLSKENAAVLLGQLRKRTDYREHNSPNVLIQNGQPYTIARTTPRNFVRAVRMRPDVWPGHELEMGQLQEGYSLQVSPLLSLDGETIDAVLKCQIDQVEKFVPVPVDVPSPAGGVQRVTIQVPQVVSWRLHERFRWPTNQVLLLGCGVVAAPGPERAGPLGLPLPNLTSSAGRADALLFIDSKGSAAETLLEAQQNYRAGTPTVNGRY